MAKKKDNNSNRVDGIIGAFIVIEFGIFPAIASYFHRNNLEFTLLILCWVLVTCVLLYIIDKILFKSDREKWKAKWHKTSKRCQVS